MFLCETFDQDISYVVTEFESMKLRSFRFTEIRSLYSVVTIKTEPNWFVDFIEIKTRDSKLLVMIIIIILTSMQMVIYKWPLSVNQSDRNRGKFKKTDPSLTMIKKRKKNHNSPKNPIWGLWINPHIKGDLFCRIETRVAPKPSNKKWYI